MLGAEFTSAKGGAWRIPAWWCTHTRTHCGCRSLQSPPGAVYAITCDLGGRAGGGGGGVWCRPLTHGLKALFCVRSGPVALKPQGPRRTGAWAMHFEALPRLPHGPQPPQPSTPAVLPGRVPAQAPGAPSMTCCRRAPLSWATVRPNFHHLCLRCTLRPWSCIARGRAGVFSANRHWPRLAARLTLPSVPAHGRRPRCPMAMPPC